MSKPLSVPKKSKKTLSQKPKKQGQQNSKYYISQFDFHPNDDEGGINSFQIYDTLSK